MAFSGVKLNDSIEPGSAIDRNKLYKSLVDGLNNRLLTTRSSNDNMRNTNEIQKNQYYDIISQIKVIYAQYWPHEFVYNYGESELESLYERFGLNTRKMIREYRIYRESSGKKIPDEINNLKNIINTTLTSTAECERGFSQMDLIITPIRNTINIQRVSNLMFIKQNGPPLRNFKAGEYSKYG